MNINRCYVGLRTCGPVVALWQDATTRQSDPLCQTCLDFWLDNADKDPWHEPYNLYFIDETREAAWPSASSSARCS